MINAELCRYVMQYPDVLYDVLQSAACGMSSTCIYLPPEQGDAAIELLESRGVQSKI